MSMVINTNIQATRTHNVYNKNNSYMNEALTRVATGQKINSAKDGAANWAISEKMRERIRANDQANQNVQNDTALLKTAQGGIDNTIDILKTLKERAINSANDSNINTDRSAIATEVYQLLGQIDDNAAKVKFNGRTLLNGEYDNGAADMFPPATETAATNVPETVTLPNVTENPTDKGSNALYKLEVGGFTAWDATNDKTLAVTDTTKLVDLVSDPDVTTDTGADANRLFKLGDTISFNWKENGTERNFSYEVKSDSSLSDLATKFQAYNTENLNYITTSYQNAANTSIATNASGTALEVQAAGTAATSGEKVGTYGLYIVGDKNAQITDLSVAVTYKDTGNNNAVTTRLDAQKAMEFTGVQQSKEADTGSHTVYAIEAADDVAAADIADGKALSALKFDNKYLFGVKTANDVLSIKIGTGEDAIEITKDKDGNALTGATTVGNLKETLKEYGITLQGVVKDGYLKDANDNYVMKDTANGSEKIQSSKGGMYFVGEDGKLLDQISFKANPTGANPTTGYPLNGNGTADADNVGYQKLGALQVAGEEETAADATKNLSFHIGGEANFYMDINIKTMTTQSLLGADAKTFADNFMTKEGSRDIISTIDNAIQTALNEQTKLGAMESRLGYTSDNITTMNENLEAADSVYRDSDIAKEMTNYMKYTVLAQASQYMLAQTSQNAFSVLNLLQA